MSESPAKEKKKLSMTQIILICGFGVVLIAVVIVAVILLTRPSELQTLPAVANAGTGNVIIDEDNAEDVIAELNRKAKEGMFEIKMNTDWSFPDGKSPSDDAYVANSRANSLPIYFEVALDNGDGTEEVIYTSPEIPVGSAVKEFALTKELPAGDYETVCTYHLLNEDKTVRSSVSVVARLHIAA